MRIAPPKSSSFSVSVVLPASGCEMIANVRRRAISDCSFGSGMDARGQPARRGLLNEAAQYISALFELVPIDRGLLGVSGLQGGRFGPRRGLP